MKRIYITEGLFTYAVETRPIETDSNYDMGISIRLVGNRYPECGTIIKSTDNARAWAQNKIKSWIS